MLDQLNAEPVLVAFDFESDDCALGSSEGSSLSLSLLLAPSTFCSPEPSAQRSQSASSGSLHGPLATCKSTAHSVRLLLDPATW